MSNGERLDFAVLDPTQPPHHAQWLALWNECPQREVFAHPDYVRLFSLGVGEPRAATLTCDFGTVLYPFIVREISGTNEADIISPYGYGGMFAWGETNRAQLQQAFTNHFQVWCTEHNVVSEFLRLSLFPSDILGYPGHVNVRAENVIVPLQVEEDDLWMSYEAKVRKNVKKAWRSEVRITVDDRGDSLEDFYRIFESTMDRREAANSYYFSKPFFQELSSSLAGHAVFFNAIHNDIVVSTELVLVGANAVYSFLGGTDAGSFDVRPNDLLKHEVNLWARAKGKRFYVLGGGYQPGDGIFRYKKAFAPHSIVPFSTGERIINQSRYDQLVADMLSTKSEDQATELRTSAFFPLYRAG